MYVCGYHAYMLTRILTYTQYCGSCWTFSTAADIEGTHYLAGYNLTSFSEQQIVACDTDMDGCEGGYMYAAMQYVTKMGGLVTDLSYPYKGIEMDYSQDTPTCKTNLINEHIETDTEVAHIEGYQMVAMGADYENLMATVMVKNGPLSLAINANGMEYYEFGITGCESIAGTEYCESGSISITTPCDPTSLDHGVVAVAFGQQDELDYWVIKNSWGAEWGEDGYCKLNHPHTQPNTRSHSTNDLNILLRTSPSHPQTLAISADRMIKGDNHCGVANMVVVMIRDLGFCC